MKKRARFVCAKKIYLKYLDLMDRNYYLRCKLKKAKGDEADLYEMYCRSRDDAMFYKFDKPISKNKIH